MTQPELYVREDTTVDEVLSHLQECVEQPHVFETFEGDKVVWNFSSYELEEDALNIENKKQDKFVIPFQVPTTWAFMFALLPEEIRNAEPLVWRPDEQEYYAYRQFYRDVPDERREQFRYEMSQRVQDALDS